jgi:hypothetical protein
MNQSSIAAVKVSIERCLQESENLSIETTNGLNVVLYKLTSSNPYFLSAQDCVYAKFALEVLLNVKAYKDIHGDLQKALKEFTSWRNESIKEEGRLSSLN